MIEAEMIEANVTFHFFFRSTEFFFVSDVKRLFFFNQCIEFIDLDGV